MTEAKDAPTSDVLVPITESSCLSLITNSPLSLPASTACPTEPSLTVSVLSDVSNDSSQMSAPNTTPLHDNWCQLPLSVNSPLSLTASTARPTEPSLTVSVLSDVSNDPSQMSAPNTTPLHDKRFLEVHVAVQCLLDCETPLESNTHGTEENIFTAANRHVVFAGE